jgi:hypothetical protein
MIGNRARLFDEACSTGRVDYRVTRAGRVEVSRRRFLLITGEKRRHPAQDATY